jgi:acetylornithine deacetylase/succinyl-diaminopimelate desuccinylase-like protein
MSPDGLASSDAAVGDAIARALAARKERFVAELRELCAIPSEASRTDALERAASWCGDRLRAAGCAVRELRVSGAPPVVVGESGAGTRTLLAVQHYDVQPAVPLELWTTPPYEPAIRDGAMYARGIADNKAQLLLRIQALELHREVSGELPIRLRFLIEGEEESTSVNLERMLAQDASLLDADGALKEGGGLDAAGRPQLILGSKGIYYCELRVRSMARDAHSSAATHLRNAAWRLVGALRTLIADDGRVLVDGFYDRVRAATAAERAHVLATPFEAAATKRTYAIDRFAFGRDDDAANLASQFEPTANICGIWSGYTAAGSKTVIPSEAAAKLDFRLVVDQDPQEIDRLLRAHLDRRGFGDVEIAWWDGERPYRGPLDDPLVRAARAAQEEAFGTEAVVLLTSLGTAPMWLISHRRGFANVTLGCAHHDSRAHAPNENILLHNYWRALRAAVRLYSRYATQT